MNIVSAHDKNIKIIVGIFYVMLLIACSISVSYAFFNNQTKEVYKKTNLYTVYSEGNRGLIIKNQKPMSINDGINSKNDYIFSVKGINNRKEDISYLINASIGSSDTLHRIDDRYIYLYMTSLGLGASDTYGPCHPIGLSNGSISLGRGEIPGNSYSEITHDYVVKLWIDDEIISELGILDVQELKDMYYSVKITIKPQI